VDPGSAAALAGWFQLGHEALAVLAADLAAEQPSDPQLFPEHFDLGITAGPVNYGCSPGDVALPEPYLYVGPHEGPSSGNQFWNTSFGAARPVASIRDTGALLDFFREGAERAVR
jgi:hypothetical protein